MQLPLKMLSQSRRGCCSWIFFIIALLIFYLYNIANVGWQLVHYTVYGTKKSDNGLLGFASSIIAFLRPVNCIVDSPPSNICILSINRAPDHNTAVPPPPRVGIREGGVGAAPPPHRVSGKGEWRDLKQEPCPALPCACSASSFCDGYWIVYFWIAQGVLVAPGTLL